LANKKAQDLVLVKNSWDKQSKIMRYLQSKGYECDLIRDAVENTSI
jgi:SOS response regulatory protein OraA/RecX